MRRWLPNKKELTCIHKRKWLGFRTCSLQRTLFRHYFEERMHDAQKNINQRSILYKLHVANIATYFSRSNLDKGAEVFKRDTMKTFLRRLNVKTESAKLYIFFAVSMIKRWQSLLHKMRKVSVRPERNCPGHEIARNGTWSCATVQNESRSWLNVGSNAWTFHAIAEFIYNDSERATTIGTCDKMWQNVPFRFSELVRQYPIFSSDVRHNDKTLSCRVLIIFRIQIKTITIEKSV